MAKLTAKQRANLPASSFAYQKQRKYPIHDAGHRQVALREAGRADTFGSKRHVKKRINQRLGKRTAAKTSAKKRTKTSRRKKR